MKKCRKDTIAINATNKKLEPEQFVVIRRMTKEEQADHFTNIAFVVEPIELPMSESHWNESN